MPAASFSQLVIFAVKILQQIDAKKASKIFNFMDKEVSAKIQKQYLLMKK
ncbi:MAG TPA: hypothetical protein VNJ01_10480 [Bacteriovoracaceae bacterium]|nr:hypothetical protein [Bacteriovoracaceae bacterium]